VHCSTTISSTRSRENDAQGKVEYIFNSHCYEQMLVAPLIEARVKCNIKLFDTHVVAPYRFMFEKISRRAEGNYNSEFPSFDSSTIITHGLIALDEQLDVMGEQYLRKLQWNELENPFILRQVTSYGDKCTKEGRSYEAEGQRNDII
jgi:hypothetical protein